MVRAVCLEECERKGRVISLAGGPSWRPKLLILRRITNTVDVLSFDSSVRRAGIGNACASFVDNVGYSTNQLAYAASLPTLQKTQGWGTLSVFL
jgi:hypothetical protein